LGEMEDSRERGGFNFEEIEKRDKGRDREERWERIRGSRFNRWYGRVKGEGIPGYLKMGWRKVDG